MTVQAFQIAGVSALGFALALLLLNLIVVPAGLPKTGADSNAVGAFFSTGRRPVAIATALGPVAWVLGSLLGAATVAAVHGQTAPTGMTWALAGFTGLLLQNATFTAVVAIRLALWRTRGDGAKPLWALHDALFTLNGTFLALAVAGLTLAGRAVGILGFWPSALGVSAAALLFVSAVMAPVVIERNGRLGVIGLCGWLLWVAWLVSYGIAFLGSAASFGAASIQVG
jgi:hypothetical protein